MLSKSTRTSLLALLALGSSLALGSCSTNPATGRSQLAMISEAQEIEMGRQADREIVASMGLYPDEALQRYVQELGLRLARSSERPNLPWQFRVLDDPTVNAFALPGGFLYVTRGILAHLSSEAELVGVLGHEIGHVTARHSVEQMSRAQLATLGLGAAAIASDSQDVARYGQLVQAGVGLMFLKFGRDDERQADDLGLRYLTRAAYDLREMPNVFRTLDRVSAAAGAGRIPNWLATHPSPADRVQRLSAAIATLPPEVQQGTVNREPYLERLAGVVYGNDPREGFFEGRAFYHPGLAFELELPAGWSYRNEKQAVIAVAPNQDAAVVLTLAGAESPQLAAQKFFSQQGIERGNEWQRRLFFNFRTLPPEQQPDARTVRGIVGFFDHQQTVFELRGLTAAERWGDYRGAVEAALGSFRRLTDRRYLEVQPARLEIVRLPSAMSFEEFLRRYPSSAEPAAIATLNGVEPGQSLAAGRLLKRVVGGARGSGG
jgi:predicted Zn-dependent protease